MSASKFWGRSRPQGEEDGQNAATGAQPPVTQLTAMDRCDRCGAQAYVRVLLPSFLELLFCAHHNRQHATALAEMAIDIQDETGRLARAA
jgi:hypothetical protein